MAVACYCCSFYRSFTRTCTLKAGVKGEGSGGFGGRWRWSWSLISALSVGEKKNTSCPLDLNRWPFLTLGRHQLYALCSVSATCRYPVERGFARNLIFAGIALKLFQVSIYVDPCHPLQQTTGDILKASNIVYRLYRTTLWNSVIHSGDKRVQ